MHLEKVMHLIKSDAFSTEMTGLKCLGVKKTQTCITLLSSCYTSEN